MGNDPFHAPRLIDKAFAKKAPRTMDDATRRSLCREYKIADSAWPAVQMGGSQPDPIRDHIIRKPITPQIHWKINTRHEEGRTFVEDIAYWKEEEIWDQLCTEDVDDLPCNCHDCVYGWGDDDWNDHYDYDDYDYEDLTL